MYYECHITMEGDSDYIKSKVEYLGWKFSNINGDPDLGDGLKCYATKHYNAKHNFESVLESLKIAYENLKYDGIKMLRKKIELVMYDERNTHDKR